MASQSKNPAEILNAAQSELKLLEIYSIHLPLINSSVRPSSGNIDTTSVQILSKFHPIALDEVAPIAVIGDGNCLYRAVSLGSFGSQEHHEHLRLLTALEMITHRSYYDCSHRKYVDLIQDERIIPENFAKLVMDACKLGAYQEMSHLYAISAAIQLPLKSYYPPTACNDFLTTPFSRRIYGRNVSESSPVAVTLMWTMAAPPKKATDFKPNHFVVLQSHAIPEPEHFDEQAQQPMDYEPEPKESTDISVEEPSWLNEPEPLDELEPQLMDYGPDPEATPIDISAELTSLLNEPGRLDEPESPAVNDEPEQNDASVEEPSLLHEPLPDEHEEDQEVTYEVIPKGSERGKPLLVDSDG